MLRINSLLVLVLFIACITGCASRPPSALQFMEAYKRCSAPQSKKVVNLSGAAVANFPAVTKRSNVEGRGDDNIFLEEMPEDLSGQLTFSVSHFVSGFDIHVFDLSPFVGVAFEHFGAMAWFELGGLLETDTHGPGYGLQIIEQFHVGENFSWGMSQHVSHNVYFFRRGSLGTVDFMEVGGGAYILGRADKHAIGLEGRYGRKVTDGMSHFALALSFM